MEARAARCQVDALVTTLDVPSLDVRPLHVWLLDVRPVSGIWPVLDIRPSLDCVGAGKN